MAEGEKPKMAKQAQELLAKLLRFIHVYATDKDDCVFMARSGWSDLEDCLVFRNVLDMKADGIVTRDVKGFVGSSVKVYDYDALFDHLRVAYGMDYDLVDL